MNSRRAFERDGFVVVEDVVTERERDAALVAFDELDDRVGRRDALDHDAIAALAASCGVVRLAAQLAGAKAVCQRAILFGKSPDADDRRRNWAVRWHQDTVVAVPERFDAAGWSAWSEKDGQPCARPPCAVLEARVSVRIDLDGSDASNGGLRVVPRSHRDGVLDPDRARDFRDRLGEHAPIVPACGALALRPLLLHASSKATAIRPRRVVHLEFGPSLRGGPRAAND